MLTIHLQNTLIHHQMFFRVAQLCNSFSILTIAAHSFVFMTKDYILL